uniref:hypothetical protein n=1 Tax=Stenotrophomonas maltophilia group sp. CASM26 TaxID=3111514 RepID=UPI003BF8054B
DLVTAIGRGEQPLPSFADGLRVQRVLDAVERSAAGGTWQSTGTHDDHLLGTQAELQDSAATTRTST